MMKGLKILIVAILTCFFSCDPEQEEEDFLINWAKTTEDTLYLSKDLMLVNIYKNQLLHYANFIKSQDTMKLITDLGELYINYLGPWGPDGCFVWDKKEFVEFNRENVHVNYGSIYHRTRHLYSSNIDSVLTKTFNGVSEYSGHTIKGRYYLYFMAQGMGGFDMGGCDINTMQVNLSNRNLTIEEIQRLFPHELNHQIFEVTSEKDPNYGSVLWGIIDEGFATYFENTFNLSDDLKSLQFTEKDYQWCLANEKEIYSEAKKLFLSTDMEDEQKLRGNQGKYLIEGAPNRLNYFLGYRIINRYVEVNGKDSWRDIYTSPVMDILRDSKYEASL